ncbi:DUF3060 domain-containing protein [Mycolicibacterium chitae]|uniref:DUF3060 domain-containing protein n=1 Tax=Mycolicibacterium sp. TaxID=2320850 RepID=UPI000F830F0A|nr:DUF3060 domain-containing protein [Mycolicibacterium chitae]
MTKARWAIGAAAAVLLTGIVLPATAQANNDSYVTGVGVKQTVDCAGGTLFVNGSGNSVTALGDCWAVTMQGSGNTVIADHVINDITVYGWDQIAYFKNGNPALIDRGRELGMTNRLARVAA